MTMMMINVINAKQRLKRTVRPIGDKVARVKQQKLHVSIDLYALFHHYSAAGFY